MTFLSLIKEISSKKWWIIIGISCGFLFSIVYFATKRTVYKSTVSFFVVDKAALTIEQNLNPSIHSPYLSQNGSIIYHKVKSTEMFDHLINKFNLYEHYEIAKSNPYYYKLINEILNNSITLGQSINNGMLVTVEDYDRLMAANLANEIYIKLNEIVQAHIQDYLEKEVRLYNEILSNSINTTSKSTDDLKNLINDYKTTIVNNSINNKTSFELNLKLAELYSQISQSNVDLTNTIKNYEIFVANLKKENQPNIWLINKALPSNEVQTVLQVIILGFLFCVLGGLVSILIIIGLFSLRMEYQNQVLEELSEKELLNVTKEAKIYFKN